MREKFVSIFISDLNKWECVNMLIRTDTDEIIGKVEKCVGEYWIHMPEFLPCKKCKVKIYINYNEEQRFYGYTNIEIISKYDNYPEGVCGSGETIEETIISTIENLIELIQDGYPEGLLLNNIEWCEFSDF